MVASGDNLYFGTLDRCSLYVHHMPSGTGTASSYKLLATLEDYGQMLADSWADVGNHVAFATAPTGTRYDSDGTAPVGSSSALGVVAKTTGEVTVHKAPLPGHRIVHLAALGPAVYGTTKSTHYSGAARLFAANPVTGEALWQREIPRENMHGMVVKDGRVFAATVGTILELDPDTGDTLRTFTLNDRFASYGPPSYALHTIPGTNRLLHAGDDHSTILSLRSGTASPVGRHLDALVFSDASGTLWSTDSGAAFQPIKMHNDWGNGTPFRGPVLSPFTDVSTKHVFYNEIAWLAETEVSGGWNTSSGKQYRPNAKVTREIMAAFLYRLAGSPEYTAQETSPFADVSTSRAFYLHMSWLAEQKISTGWAGAGGTRLYKPDQDVLRDQMAAFMYRLAGSPAYTAPAKSPFTDVRTSHDFYKEISWLAHMGISTGWAATGGTRIFGPGRPVLRDQMAAFMYRLAASAL